MAKSKRHNLTNNKGFTLVELIIVLVILAILAAILVPTLMGYINEAKVKRYLPNAQACKDAAQAAFVELYAKNGDIEPGTPIISDGIESGTNPNDPNLKDDKQNKDQDISNTDIAKSILSYAGVKPYLFMVAVGSNSPAPLVSHTAYTTTSAYEKYTIYYAVYMETKDSIPLYYYNNEWSTHNPRPGTNRGEEMFDQHNIIKSGPLKGLRLQYYLIICQNSTYQKDTYPTTVQDPKFWTWLKNLEPEIK